MKKAWMLLLPILAVGCARTVEVENKADYKCGTEVVSAQFLEDDTAILNINNVNYVLNRVVTDSGAKYQSMKSDISFWNKGGEAYLQIGEKPYPRCKEIIK